MCKPLVIETLKYLYELDVDAYQVRLISISRNRNFVLSFLLLSRIYSYKIQQQDHVFHMKYFLLSAVGQVAVRHHQLNYTMCVLSKLKPIRNQINSLQTRADKWIPLPFNDKCKQLNLPKKHKQELILVPRAYHGIVTIKQLIYVIGGFDGMEYFNSCRVFDSQNFQWKEIAPMNVKRCYVSVALHNGLIYAMVIINESKQTNKN